MKIDKIIKTPGNRYIPKGTVIIKDLTSKMSLPKVIIDDAIWIYKKVVKHNIPSKSTKKMNNSYIDEFRLYMLLRKVCSRMKEKESYYCIQEKLIS